MYLFYFICNNSCFFIFSWPSVLSIMHKIKQLSLLLLNNWPHVEDKPFCSTLCSLFVISWTLVIVFVSLHQSLLLHKLVCLLLLLLLLLLLSYWTCGKIHWPTDAGYQKMCPLDGSQKIWCARCVHKLQKSWRTWWHGLVQRENTRMAPALQSLRIGCSQLLDVCLIRSLSIRPRHKDKLISLFHKNTSNFSLLLSGMS